MPIHPTRREILVAGLFGGVSLLTGCASSSRGPNTVGQPMPRIRTYDHDDSPSYGGPAGLDILPEGVIPRRAWTNTQPIASLANPMGRVQRITIHHDAINSLDVTSRAAAERRLASIREGHLQRDFADIGYHFIVDPMGNIWEGRPLRYQGAHVKDQNENNMGIMVMGNFMEQSPTPAALSALDSFVASQKRRFGVPAWDVKTHQERAKTECPGTSLQRYLLATRAPSGRMARAWA